MKNQIFASLSLSLMGGFVLFAVACAPGGNRVSRPTTAASSQTSLKTTASIWIAKSDASELREGGTLNQTCEYIKQDPQNQGATLLQTDASGKLYSRGPEAQLMQEKLMGQITPNGFVPTEEFKKENAQAQISVKELNGELLITEKNEEGKDEVQTFVQSNEEELQKFFAALEACKAEAGQTK